MSKSVARQLRTSDAADRRPRGTELTAIHAGDWLLKLLVIATVVGLWH
jgi:hypothetical protein